MWEAAQLIHMCYRGVITTQYKKYNIIRFQRELIDNQGKILEIWFIFMSGCDIANNV